MQHTILVTGGAGFIGQHFVRSCLNAAYRVVNLDLLTYASSEDSLRQLADEPQHLFTQGDIADSKLVRQLLAEHQPAAVVNLAAESHVDRSIDTPQQFIETNVLGTGTLLCEVLGYWEQLSQERKKTFRFLQASTDEVFGSLGETGAFQEEDPYRPNSPYSASKAAADHLVRAYHQTYGLPTLITHSSNNYGPGQHAEKLIPGMILAAANNRPMPLFGDGQQVRDWLHVKDQCSGLLATLDKGRPGQAYNLGGENQRTNQDIVTTIARLVDQQQPGKNSREQLITHVADRLGHDQRYALNIDKAARELDWEPEIAFASGLSETVQWYFDHPPPSAKEGYSRIRKQS